MLSMGSALGSLLIRKLSKKSNAACAGEAAALLPVVGMMLHFSPAEIKRCQDALARERAAEGVVDASAMNSVDGSSSEYGMLSGWTSWAFGGSAEEPAKRPALA